MKIAWLTNFQAPYREPMWTELAALAELTVSFLFREERRRHWVWRENAQYRSAPVPTWTVPLPRSVARRLDDPLAALGRGVTGQVLHGADALVIHEWWQLAYVWCALRAHRMGVPYLIYSESTLNSHQFSTGLPARFRSVVFRNAGAVIVPGPAAADAAVANGAVAARVVESVNSIDQELFGPEVRRIRGRLRPDGVHRFAYVGQLVGRKNVASLIRAFGEVGADATLDVAGDGAELAALRSLAAECGVADRVRFLGFLAEPELVRLLARTHTVVLPSTEEVFGFTALEAYLAGLQVVVSRQAGVAASLAGRDGVRVVEPTQEALGTALVEARTRWVGWRDDVATDCASPRRAALDVLRAVQIARSSPGR